MPLLWIGLFPGLTKAAALSSEKRQQKLILGKTPLTRGEVHDYYMNPKVRRAILKQIGKQPVTVIQSFDGRDVLRRRRPQDGYIKGKDYQQFVEKRTVEFHPTFGAKTKFLAVDIDPKGASFAEAKKAAKQVAQAIRKLKGVKGVDFVYTGGRGLYVKAPLAKSMSVDKARQLLKQHLSKLKSDKITLKPPKPGQIRLDVSTLHRMGSLRAAYSINRETGRVALPIRNLATFTPEKATVRNALRSLS